MGFLNTKLIKAAEKCIINTMFKKLLFMILIGFLSFKFFTSAEFSKFANDNDTLKSLFKAKEEGEFIEGRQAAPIKYTECYEYFKKYTPDRAIICYKRKLIDDRNNPELHYYLAFSYYGNRDYSSALFHTDYIMKNLKDSGYTGKASSLKNRIEADMKEKERLETTDKPDYYDELENKRYWGKMPITVWIEPSSNDFNLKNAFNTWQTALYPTISFKMVQKQEDANIVVKFIDKAEKYCPHVKNAAGCNLSRVYNNNKNMLYDSKIYLSRYGALNERISDSYIYGTLCHEIGHALGMGGHSDNRSDVMYGKSGTYNTRPTARDIRTLERIYSLKN